MKNPFKLLLVLSSLMIFQKLHGQTLIINEVSQGVSGNMEYVEFVVVDSTVVYSCTSPTPPCIDIRGWIFDDNSGYHGTSGIASGCIRFSFDNLWSCVPLGTIIVVYNDADPNPEMPADDLLLNDGNCKISAPISNTALFESNSTTPGAVACSYPATGWTPGGNWSTTLLANGGDCARIVDLAGCEVFSVCWSTANQNNLIYFSGGATSATSATNTVYYFNSGDPEDVANWTIGCADIPACGQEDQTPGAPNNAANDAFIAQFNNSCQPITPIVASAAVDMDAGCLCDGQATASGSGSIPGYTYEWLDSLYNPIGQTNVTASGLCGGTYYAIVTSSIGCPDTATINIQATGTATVSVDSAIVCAGDSTVLTATPSAGGGTYTWNPGGETTQSITITPGTTTTYTVGYDLGICSAMDSTTVQVFPTYDEIENISACENSTVIYPDGTSEIVLADTSHISYLFSLSGCDSLITTQVTMDPTPGPPTAGSDNSYCLGEAMDTLMAVPSSGGTISWYLDAGLTNLTGTGPTLAPLDQEGVTIYYVTETVNNCEGPESMVTITINICDIIIPTAFTPNNDLVNDAWEIIGLDMAYPNNVVRIYNRWGNLLFEHLSENGSSPYSENMWDGKYNGKDLPTGSYYYIIDYDTDDQDKGSSKGTVTIILN